MKRQFKGFGRTDREQKRTPGYREKSPNTQWQD
jgi:hypothetical protein